MTEMRIAEACCVFEPEAESAISPNMNDPDRADRKEEWRRERPRKEGESGR